jgi:hypothetical protein
MKALLLVSFALTAILSANGAATGTTTSAVTSSTSFPAPKDFSPSDVTGSVGPETDNTDASASDAQYWICLSISPSTFRYGWAQGDSESSARAKAEKNCGKGDCDKHWACGELGCIGLDFGLNAAWVSWASGYGRGDPSKAESLALNACEEHDTHCGKPGYFCSKYIR